LPSERLDLIIPLAGRSLKVGESVIQLQAPTLEPLTPACTLAAKLVTIKNATEPGPFLEAARRRLAELPVSGEPAIPLVQKGDRAGEPRRLVVRVKGCRIVAFPVVVSALTAEESVRLQEAGLGGRRRMGCGLFVPSRG
jgi:CRISPR-associated protein Cas6